MYTEGLQIGDNSYLLSDESGTLKLINGNCTSQEMEEYIKLKNDYEERGKRYSELNSILHEAKGLEKESKHLRIKFFIASILIEGGFIVVGAGLSALSYPFTLELLISIGAILFGTSMITPSLIYGTKKTRKRIIKEANEHLEREEKEIEKIVEKLQALDKKIESELIINKKENEIVPVTTVDNKKTNVKMRLLRLNQSR